MLISVLKSQKNVNTRKLKEGTFVKQLVLFRRDSRGEKHGKCLVIVKTIE